MAIIKMSGTPKEQKLYTQDQIDILHAEYKELEEASMELMDANTKQVKIIIAQHKEIDKREKIILILGGLSVYYIALHHFF